MAKVREYQNYPPRNEEIRRAIKAIQLGSLVGTAANVLAGELIKNRIGRDRPVLTGEREKEELERAITLNKPQYVDKHSSPISILQRPKSRITIIDFDSDDNDSIELTWIPKSISYKPESKLVALVSTGRNNPFYHYGGSEDSVEFSIDWFFTNDYTRKEALRRARWLESMSKGDGYGPMHRVKLVWGESKLFENSLFLVESAGYEMTNWVDWGMRKNDKAINGLEFEKFGLLPQRIVQDVILKRVTAYNLEFEDIREVTGLGNDLFIDISSMAPIEQGVEENIPGL